MLDTDLKFYAVPARPPMWPWSQGHELWNFSVKFLVNVFSTFLLWKQLRKTVGRTSFSLVTLTCGSWSEGQHDPYFTVRWFYLISLRLFDVWTSYFGIMSKYDTTFDLKINVGRCDLYFMVQWFCPIFWRLFDIWTPYFGIMGRYDPMFDLKNICRTLWPIFHGPVILPYVLKTIQWLNIILMSQYGPTSDLKIFVGRCDLYFNVHWICLISWRLFDVWTSYFGIMSQYDTKFDLEINVGHCELYFMIQWFCLIS